MVPKHENQFIHGFLEQQSYNTLDSNITERTSLDNSAMSTEPDLEVDPNFFSPQEQPSFG